MPVALQSDKLKEETEVGVNITFSTAIRFS